MSMPEGRVAVITGSTHGIGLAIAHALASRKASIMLNGFGDAASEMPSGQTVAPEQVAEMAAFLCSDAASEIRGSAQSIDGGWFAR